MIEAYPAAADDFLPYVGKTGNMSALRQFCLIVAAIFQIPALLQTAPRG